MITKQATETLTLDEFAARYTPPHAAPLLAPGILTDTAAIRDLIRPDLADVWRSDAHMLDYCAEKAAALAILPGGAFVVVEKQAIEKDFCFGESGYDYEDAQKAAQHARTSAEHFKRENMKRFDEWTQSISESMSGEGYQRLVILDRAYYSQTNACRLRGATFARLSDIIEACGGSCRLDELPGKALTVRGQYCHVATQEEHEILLRAWQAAAQAHEKKVDAYLKRYGTSKVNAWTYWRDA